MFERKNIVDRSSTFFDGTLVPLDCGNMFIVGYDVELHMEIRYITAEGLKLPIAKDKRNLESTSLVQSNNVDDVLDNRGIFHVVEFGSCSEFDMFGDTHQKRDGVDFHNVNSQPNCAVLFHNGTRDVHNIGGHAIRLTPDGLPFERPKIWSKNNLGVLNVLDSDGTVRNLFPFDISEIVTHGWTTNALLNATS